MLTHSEAITTGGWQLITPNDPINDINPQDNTHVVVAAGDGRYITQVNLKPTEITKKP